MNPLVIKIVKYVLPYVAWVISLLIPGRRSRMALLEAKNKADIMSLVNEVESVLPPPGQYPPLQELVDRSYAMGPFPALWAVEGLGNYYAESFRQRKIVLKGILTDPKLADLPSKSMTMLHAGIGLSFAKRSLEGLTAQSPVSEIRKALEKFITLCKDNCRPGYMGCTSESLGLVTFILHSPELARILDRELTQMEPTFVSYMWRGSGRALYFHPKNFIPGFKSPWRGIEMCSQLAPHEIARRNLRAGISWAFTLVNMRHPQIMETLLLHQGENFPDRDLFINGMTSSVIMRYDTSPDDSYIWKFIEHRPAPSNALLCRLWENDVRKPLEAALREIYPVLKEHSCLDEVFHYQSLPELASRLKGVVKPGAQQSAVGGMPPSKA